MTEPRQQRRARERAEQKATTRPGPNPREVPAPEVEEPGERSAVIEVELHSLSDRPSDTPSDWAATWGEQDSDYGIQAQNGDLRSLVEEIVDDVRERWDGYELTIEWDLDTQADRTAESSGIDFPRTLSPTA